MILEVMRSQDRRRWRGAVLAAAVCTLASVSAMAAPTLRFQIEQKGDILLIGNTLGQECRARDSTGAFIPAPVVGTVGSCGDPTTIADSAPDALWQSDSPGSGQVQAAAAITPANARSTAVLNLPASAKVAYARLYWGGNLGTDMTEARSPVQIERPGASGFSVTLQPDPLRNEVATLVGGGGGFVYQASAEVTALVQQHGSGPYRIGNVVRRGVASRDEDVQFAAWSMVVIYQSSAEPVRSIALYDGLDSVPLGGQSLSFRIDFNAPIGTALEGKLGIIAYDGDSDKTESFKLNGQPLQDALNPADNLLNGTRSLLGAPVSIAGDLPQLTGGVASMSGLDLDVLDISSLIRAGDSSLSIAASTTQEASYIGALVISIRSQKECGTSADCPDGQTCDPTKNACEQVGSLATSDCHLGTAVVPSSGSLTGGLTLLILAIGLRRRRGRAQRTSNTAFFTPSVR